MPNDLQDRRFAISAAKNELKGLCEFHEIDLTTYKGEQRKDKIARNLVDFEAGKTIFATALGIILSSKVKTPSLFDGVF